MWFLLILKIFILASANSFESDYFDDSTLFRISIQNRDVLDNRLGGKNTPESLIPIVSADDEKYFCIIPEIITKKKDPITDYTGPTPAEFLASIYKGEFCSLRIESYWRYELCHGKFLRQYHDDKDGKITAEYYLGSFPKDKNEATLEFDATKPPVKDFDGKLLPYYPVQFIHGTYCDLSKQPRKTTVMYICSPDQARSFQSITEIKSCVYEAVVAVKELCLHPAFKKEEPVEHEIQCFGSDDVGNSVPKSMLRFQNEVKARPMLPLKSNQGPLTSRVPSKYIKQEVYELFKNNNALKQIKELKNILEAVRRPKQTANEENLMASFWSGKACLYGGSGYWRYEFCFNRQVSQFHEEADGKTTRINLFVSEDKCAFYTQSFRGYYDPKLHQEWATKTGSETRKVENGHVKQLSMMYSRGDLCKEANTLRKCEVRMKCVENEEDPTVINMFLVEPEKCSYILLVESPMICEQIQTADEFGFISATQLGQNEFLERGEEDEDGEEEEGTDGKVKF